MSDKGQEPRGRKSMTLTDGQRRGDAFDYTETPTIGDQANGRLNDGVTDISIGEPQYWRIPGEKKR